MAGALADIAEVLATIANGRADATTVHNVGAWTRQLVAAAGLSPEQVQAGRDLIRACEELAAARGACLDALAEGVYPELAERAGAKLRVLAELVRR